MNAPAPSPTLDSPEQAQAIYGRITEEIGKVIVGQEEVIAGLLVSLFAKGHCLLIGVPGLAKTLLVRSLAEVLDIEFRRVQFTPDLMPSDILGTEILKEKAGTMEFEFQIGPVFTNLLLADEINRTPPKTQSALLEAMQERRVTVAGKTLDLPDPFLVVATQNPIEHEGTYPLPEAQLDRFMFSIQLDYPGRDNEVEVVSRTTFGELPKLQPVVSRDEILGVQHMVRAMAVSEHVIRYAVELACATRPDDQHASQTAKDYIEWGAGPRASQYLILAAKSLALMNGRAAPEASDVRSAATLVLQHRIVTNYRAMGEGIQPAKLIEALVKTVSEPNYKPS